MPQSGAAGDAALPEGTRARLCRLGGAAAAGGAAVAAGEATPHLRVVDPESDLPEPTSQLADRILVALAQADRPLSRDALRHTLGIRNATLGEILARLRAERRIERRDGGFVLDR